jgi:hypothetical protein
MQRYSGMVNYKNIPAFFKILPDLLRIPDIIRNFAGDYEKDRSCQGTGSWHTRDWFWHQQHKRGEHHC